MIDSTFSRADPNVVLRGGPLDGRCVHVAAWVPIRLDADGSSAVYRPTSELDTEFPTLAIWVFDHAETV
ncbi:hypothetical protein [Actinospica robiniae]|uniref:hypothetical protein n=1 Tax=Actinospica robiniae TaxID=304901 RepID=UPI00040B8333|nr:hypothetical protein [Actinospica robiniae]